jgi:hypothetical protein
MGLAPGRDEPVRFHMLFEKKNNSRAQVPSDAASGV